MPDKEQGKNSGAPQKKEIPLSETIQNAHGSGDGSLRLSEDGLIEPSGETIADAEANAHNESKTKQEEY